MDGGVLIFVIPRARNPENQRAVCQGAVIDVEVVALGEAAPECSPALEDCLTIGGVGRVDGVIEPLPDVKPTAGLNHEARFERQFGDPGESLLERRVIA